MIRIAFLLVTLLGGVIAFGAFYLVRGVGSTPSNLTATAPPVGLQPEDEPDPTRLYYLSDIAFDKGEITLLLFDVGHSGTPLIIRDQEALIAAQDVASAPSFATNAPHTGRLALTEASTAKPFVQIYRNDSLIASVACSGSICEMAPDTIELNHAGLTEHAMPNQLVNDQFGDHATYLDTILAVTEDPDFMFLDLRPEAPFPREQQLARMELALPTLISPADATFDPNVTSALARTIVEPFLPEGAQVSEVVFTTTGEGLVADGDSGTPVLAGGAPIPFPAVKFTSVTVSIEGASTLSHAALDSLSGQPPQRTDYEDAFETFIAQRLQSSCADCFTVKMNGDFYDEATIIASQPESYSLEYYDLREAP